VLLVYDHCSADIFFGVLEKIYFIVIWPVDNKITLQPLSGLMLDSPDLDDYVLD
jgi:hypothetical protein